VTESPSQRRTTPSARVREIATADLAAVCEFLRVELNRRVPATAWRALFEPPWGPFGPNHGYQLLDPQDKVVGVYAAVYSTRDEGRVTVCNLAAFCVVQDYRQHAALLARAVTRQKGYSFTDLSPSGNVPALNARLGFERLDTATRLVLNTPGRARGRSVTEDPGALETSLIGRDLRVYTDHRSAAAARHLIMEDGGDYAYLMYRRDRRRRLPLFASPIYAGGSRELLELGWSSVGSHLLRKGLVATLGEVRILGFAPPGPGRELAAPRVKMFKGRTAAEVDYLYSELTLLEW
jgi:hypothetical protein